MSLHFERLGTGRPLLMVHGLGANLRSWDPLLTALRGSRELILVDLPGHGRSAPLAGRQTVEAYADALTSFMQSHGLADSGPRRQFRRGPAGAGAVPAGHRSALRGARSRRVLARLGDTLVLLDARGIDSSGAVAATLPSPPVAPRRYPHAAAGPVVGPSVAAAAAPCRRASCKASRPRRCSMPCCVNWPAGRCSRARP